MVWVVLAAIGIPLWLCALGITVLAFRSRGLRARHGNIPVRVLSPGKSRWVRGNALWVSDVFAWRGSPAAWDEELVHVVGLRLRAADPAEQKRLHGLGVDPVVAVLSSADGTSRQVAAAAQHEPALLGPFADTHTTAIGR
jgi:hypothetical protein